MASVRYTVIHNVKSHMLSPVQDAMVSFESETTAEPSKPTIFELPRSRFSWISISMMNFCQNASTSNNLSCSTTPVPPEIRNIKSENYPLGQTKQTLCCLQDGPYTLLARIRTISALLPPQRSTQTTQTSLVYRILIGTLSTLKCTGASVPRSERPLAVQPKLVGLQ
jgi:hypothetical protein